MYYDEMILSENTDHLYDRWSEYRKELTEYIIGSVEDFYIKRKLYSNCARRLSCAYNIEDIVRELGYKPTLSLWGAGGCNDIDIRRLSQYFRLVLIDRDMNTILSVRERLGLREWDCLCVDLRFWDVGHEDYRMFEALLRDKASGKELSAYFDELTEHMTPPDYDMLPDFDFSVVVAIASQLNSRFAALTHIYGAGELIGDKLNALNRDAVTRMLHAVEKMTKHMIIAGYELDDSVQRGREALREQLADINEETMISCGTCRNMISGMKYGTSVAGNDILEEGLLGWLGESDRFCMLRPRAMLWPFTEDKEYLMFVAAIEKTNKD